MPASSGTILVTGANGGLGAAVVSKIAHKAELRSYHGIYTVRNEASDTSTLDAVLAHGSPRLLPHSYEKLPLDLSRQSNVREAAKAINDRVASGELAPIRAIVLNAGYQEFQAQAFTSDGLDATFAVNYLNQWLFSLLLLQSLDRDAGRIVWISSWSHNRDHPFQSRVGAYNDEKYNDALSNGIEQLAKGTWSSNTDDKTGWAAGYRRYSTSKLCIVTMIHELQHRLDQDPLLNKISVLAVDPGTMSTSIVRRSDSWFLRIFMFRIMLPVLVAVTSRLFPNGNFRTLKKSAGDIIAASFDNGPPPLSQRPKALYLDGSQLGEYDTRAKDPARREILWRGSVQFAHLKEGDCMLERWE